MKIMIDIPKEFEEHFNQDKFKDSISRIAADVISQVYSVSGDYEIELLDMLSEAFEKAEVIHSTCVLEGKPIYNDASALEAKWTYLFGSRNEVRDIIVIGKCSNCHQLCEHTDYCPNCGAKLI